MRLAPLAGLFVALPLVTAPLVTAPLVTAPLAAQAAAPAAPAGSAVGTITQADVARRIRVIADDSMGGRDTPSRGLDLTARYVADQFKRFGLKPGGDAGTWLQHYPVSRRRLLREGSRVTVAARGRTAEAPFATSARYLFGPIPTAPLAAPAVLVGGPLSAEWAGDLDVKGKIVLLAMSREQARGPVGQQVARALYRDGPKAVVLLSDDDSLGFAKRLGPAEPERTVIGGGDRPVMLEVRADAVAGPLGAAGADLAAARDADAPSARPLPAAEVRIEMRDSVVSELTAPNAVGILEGRDPKLRDEYVVFSAHMDHIGITPGQRDSINNGADDDASGTAGVVELAEAFSRPGARPRRSLIFLTVSGEEKGLWGSRYFTEHPPVPIERIVADINIDMIGRNWPDTIVAIGREHSDLGATLGRVNAAHPELRMAAASDRWPEERFYFRSDHYNFARRGVPILFFFNGVHPDYHQVTDSPDKIDAEKEARILRLIYYLGKDVADAPRRPRWDPESYREIVERP